MNVWHKNKRSKLNLCCSSDKKKWNLNSMLKSSRRNLDSKGDFCFHEWLLPEKYQMNLMSFEHRNRGASGDPWPPPVKERRRSTVRFLTPSPLLVRKHLTPPGLHPFFLGEEGLPGEWRERQHLFPSQYKSLKRHSSVFNSSPQEVRSVWGKKPRDWAQEVENNTVNLHSRLHAVLLRRNHYRRQQGWLLKYIYTSDVHTKYSNRTMTFIGFVVLYRS